MNDYWFHFQNLLKCKGWVHVQRSRLMHHLTGESSLLFNIQTVHYFHPAPPVPVPFSFAHRLQLFPLLWNSSDEVLFICLRPPNPGLRLRSCPFLSRVDVGVPVPCWWAVRMRPGQLILLPAAATALLFLLSGLSLTSGCNKALCASDVSKCLIQVNKRGKVFTL